MRLKKLMKMLSKVKGNPEIMTRTMDLDLEYGEDGEEDDFDLNDFDEDDEDGADEEMEEEFCAVIIEEEVADIVHDKENDVLYIVTAHAASAMEEVHERMQKREADLDSEIDKLETQMNYAPPIVHEKVEDSCP